MGRMSGARRIVLAVVAVVIVVFAGVVVAALRYQPLKSDDGASGFDVIGADGRSILDAVKRKDGIVFPSEGLATVKSLDSQVVMEFSIRNDGRFPVRLTKVRSPGGPPFKQRAVSMGNEHDALPDRPFRPVVLKPDEVRMIGVKVSPACLDTRPGFRIAFPGASIEYSFAGVHHTTWVPFQSYGFAIEGVKVCD